MEGYLTAEISVSAVAHNVRLIRSRLQRGTLFCPAVKADCYGHGLQFVLPALQDADCLAVATPQEAIQVRQTGWTGDILAFFSPCAYQRESDITEALDELIAAKVSLTVVKPDDVLHVCASASRLGMRAKVHLKVDSGMHRSGVHVQSAVEIIELVGKHPQLELAGVYTHFATADEADKQYALNQLDCFRQAAAGLKCKPLLHAANSAALIDMPQSHLDMVRPGIALYGYQPSDEMHNKLPLRPVLRVLSRVMQVREVPAGAAAGYGLTRRFERATRLGLVPIGYADGYFRCLSNKAVMKIGQAYAPVAGRVSMDQTILDITDAGNVSIGQQVEVISDDPAAPNSVENLAKLAGTIPHEVTCRLGGRIRRVAMP